MTGRVDAPLGEVAALTVFAASDAHVGGTGAAGYELGEPSFAAWIPLANASGADVVLSIGDQAHTEASIEDAGAYIATLNNATCALGNHDELGAPGNNYTQAKADAIAAYGMPGTKYAFDAGFVRVCVLDTNFDGSDNDTAPQEGHLPAAEQSWLQNELDTTDRDAVLIVMHHPPVETFNGGVQFDATDIGELTTIVASHANVFILAAHSHPYNNYRFYLGSVPVWVFAPLTRQRYDKIRISKYGDGSCSWQVVEMAL